MLFFFNDTATTEIYTLSLHDALPIYFTFEAAKGVSGARLALLHLAGTPFRASARPGRSEEHTSELQSLAYLVCRLLLEKKKTKPTTLQAPRQLAMTRYSHEHPHARAR